MHNMLNTILSLIHSEHQQLCDHDLKHIRSVFDQLISSQKDIDPDILEAAQIFEELKSEIELHALEEEQFLLPLAKRILSQDELHIDNAAEAIRTIHAFSEQHDDFNIQSNRIIELIQDMHLDDENMPTKEELVDLMYDLKQLMQRHTEKEHLILFPALEQRLSSCAP